jgi:hypothetical protein
MIWLLASIALAQVPNGHFTYGTVSWNQQGSCSTWGIRYAGGAPASSPEYMELEGMTCGMESEPFLLTQPDLAWHHYEYGYDFEIWESPRGPNPLYSTTFGFDVGWQAEVVDVSAWCGTMVTLVYTSTVDDAFFDAIEQQGAVCAPDMDPDTSDTAAYATTDTGPVTSTTADTSRPADADPTGDTAVADTALAGDTGLEDPAATTNTRVHQDDSVGVRAAGTGCGCNHTAPTGWWGLLLLVLTLGRPRAYRTHSV